MFPGDHMAVGFITTDMQAVTITNNVVSSNSTHGEMYLIQHYVIKFVNDLKHVSGFLWGPYSSFPPPIKLTRHDIIKILLNVALITIALTQYCHFVYSNRTSW